MIIIKNETKGAICSCLLAIEHINNDDELIIANADQVIGKSINDIINEFRKKRYDAGTICTESIHPNWAYVLLDKKNMVVEAAPKNPISKNATAGFYYYKKGSDFVGCAMKVIEKDISINGQYYVASTLNELVLLGKKIGVKKIDNSYYHSFYSPQKIKEYESMRSRRKR